MTAVGEAFVLKLIARASASGSLGTASLDHEVRDDPVKDQTIVVSPAGEIEKAGTGHRGVAGVEGDVDGTLGGVERDLDVVHGSLLRGRAQDSSSTGKLSVTGGHGREAIQHGFRAHARLPQGGEGESVITGGQSFAGLVPD